METREDVSFILKSTAIVRGYIGNWEIKNNKLFLISLLGFIENQEQVDLNFLFPDKNEVFADWFTGDIRIPQGKMLKKVNLGYESIFEKNRILRFKEGVFTNETVENQVDKDKLKYVNRYLSSKKVNTVLLINEIYGLIMGLI